MVQNCLLLRKAATLSGSLLGMINNYVAAVVHSGSPRLCVCVRVCCEIDSSGQHSRTEELWTDRDWEMIDSDSFDTLPAPGHCRLRWTICIYISFTFSCRVINVCTCAFFSRLLVYYLDLSLCFQVIILQENRWNNRLCNNKAHYII